MLRPSASLRATCGARSSRGLAKLATLRFAQTTRSLIRLALRSSAHPQGVGTEIPNSRKPQGLAKASPCLSWFVLWYLSPVPTPDCPVLAGPRSAETSGSGPALSERSEFSRTPLGSSTAGCPERSGGTQTAGRPSFGYFSLAKQRKVPRPPGRDPASSLSRGRPIKPTATYPAP